MKKSKLTEEQILFALKQGDAGQPIADVCRQMGISEATYYVWKKRCANMRLLADPMQCRSNPVLSS